MGARADDAATRSERARAIGLFRYGLIREAADPGAVDPRPGPAGPRGRRGRAHRPDRAPGAGLARHAGPLDPGVAARRVRRVGAQPAPDRAAVAGRGGRDGGRAQAGEPRPDRCAGPPDPGHPDGVGAGRADPATLVRRRPADRRPGVGGRVRAGVRAVRGVAAQRVVDRRRPARPARRRPQDLSVRLPRRPLPGDHGAPVRVRRGHRAARRRAAPRARLARGPRRDLCRQRLGVRRRLAAARLREARHPADPLHPGSAAGPRQDRTLLPDRPRAVPRRDHREPRGRPEPAPGRRPGRAQRAVHRLGRDRLPPPDPLRDRPGPARPLERRWPVSDPEHRRAGRGVPLGGTPHRHQDRAGVAAGQHLPGRPAAGRAPRRAGVRPVRPHPHPGPAPRRPGRHRDPAPDRAPRPPQGPTRDPTRAAGSDRDRLRPPHR